MHRQIAGKLTGPATKWIVLAVSLVLTGVGFWLGGMLNDVKNNEQSSWVPSSAESTRVAEEISGEIDPNDIPTLVVYHRDGGLTDADLAEIEADAAEISQLDGVVDGLAVTPGVNPGFLSQDGDVAYTYFTFNFGKDGWNKLEDPIKDIKDLTEMDGVDVHIGGYGGQAYDFISSFGNSHIALLVITFLVVIVILLLTYRSAFLWILPILSAGLFANTLAGGAVYLMAKYAGLVVNDQSQYILSILVIGAGTDYALLLVARYREELRRHEDRHEAMAVALHRAAPAIIASAATVVVGLMCLAFADLNSTASLGPVLAVGVGTTLLVMLTVLPALLVICGRWVFGPRREGQRTWVKLGLGMIGGGVLGLVVGGVLTSADVPFVGGLLSGLGALSAFLGVLVLVQVGIEHWTSVHSRPDYGSTEPTSTGLWSRVGDRIKVRPRFVWIGTALVLATACLGLTQLNANGLSTEDSFTDTLDSVTAQQLLFEHDLVDNSNTLQVVTNTAKLPETQAALADVDGLGEPLEPTQFGDRTLFEIPLKFDYATQEAFDLVEAARDDVHAVEGADALVGGGAAFYLDTKTASLRDNKVVIPLVLLVVLVILILLLRALTAPLILVATVILSFGAALGLSSLLFKYVFDFAGSDPGFPLFAFVFLVALGVDYNIFLMTRVREETERFGTRRGSLIALSSTGGVITSAGLVLAATFVVLATLPFVFLVELGTAVALGVLLDTMIVRSVLVTAINLDLGGKIWWPSNLDRNGHTVEPPAEDKQLADAGV
jgi:RND superfamily putative drug exporter